MAFDKDYPNRKDKRRRYYGSEAFDASCRPHGSCPWCQGNREHKHKKRKLTVKEEVDETR